MTIFNFANYQNHFSSVALIWQCVLLT